MFTGRCNANTTFANYAVKQSSNVLWIQLQFIEYIKPAQPKFAFPPKQEHLQQLK